MELNHFTLFAPVVANCEDRSVLFVSNLRSSFSIIVFIKYISFMWTSNILIQKSNAIFYFIFVVCYCGGDGRCCLLQINTIWFCLLSCICKWCGDFHLYRYLFYQLYLISGHVFFLSMYFIENIEWNVQRGTTVTILL